MSVIQTGNTYASRIFGSHVDFGTVVESARVKRRLNRVQLAKLAGVSNAAIGGLEKRHTDPRMSTLRAIAGGLNMSIQEMIDEADVAPLFLDYDYKSALKTDDQNHPYRMQMKAWDKKLTRLDDEMLTYIHQKTNAILGDRDFKRTRKAREADS